MAHLRHLGLKNFRVFGKDAPMLSLAPITLVTGANNSGKSSIIKALLLLQKSIQKYPRLEKLDFTGGGHHLGNYGNTFSKGEEGSMIFAVPFPIFFNPNFVLELHYVGDTEQNQREFSPRLVRSKIFEFPSKKVLLDVWEIPFEAPTHLHQPGWDEVVGKFGVKFDIDLLKGLIEPIYEKWSKHKVELEANKKKSQGNVVYGRMLRGGINESTFKNIYGYSWNNGETTEDLSGLPPGDYLLNVSLTNSTCSGNILVLIYEPPLLEVFVDLTPEVGNQFSAEASIQGGVPPYYINWSNGESGNTINQLSPGFYSVMVEDNNGCLSENDFEVIATKLEEESNILFFDIFPNPTNGKINIISTFAESVEGEIQVYNILGQKIYTQYFSDDELDLSIDLNQEMNGVYFVRIHTQKGNATKRVLLIDG